MLELGTVEVWGTFYRRITDERLLADYRRLLSADERARELRFVHSDDSRRYLVTRALVRTLLSQRLRSTIAPHQWSFAADRHGRPLITNTLADDDAHLQRVSFNISHTAGLILVGLARDGALGLDVEQVLPRPSLPRIARRYFAPQEVAALSALPHAAQLRGFYEYWTLKESYLKALGVGLTQPLNQFAFELGPGRLRFMTQDLGPQSRGWHFWQMSFAPDCLGAVCARLPGGGPPRLLLRAVVPLADEATLDHSIIRTSDSAI